MSAIKPPPHSIEAEQYVLGAVLVNAAAYDDVADVVTAEDFYRQDHATIWREATRIIEAGERPDIVTMAERIGEDRGPMLAYLGEMIHNTPSTANVRAYARVVAERSRERALIAASRTVAEASYGRDAPFAERLDAAQAAVLGVAESSTKAPRPIADVLKSAVAGIEARFDRGGGLSGISTGFPDLDRQLDGLHRGNFIVLAARPKVGKSALALDIALHVAREHGVLYASLEMRAEELVDRGIASRGRALHAQIRSGRIAEDQWPRITSGIAALSTLRLLVDEDSTLTLAALRARARRARRELGDLSLVVVDYLQLVTPPPGGRDRREHVDALSRGMKILAKDLDVPILCLAQLSRDLEKRANKRPMLSDLRESGGIEQDADVVLFLYRPSLYGDRPPGRPDFTEVIISKQRAGADGSVWLQYQGEHTTFVTPERPPDMSDDEFAGHAA